MTNLDLTEAIDAAMADLGENTAAEQRVWYVNTIAAAAPVIERLVREHIAERQAALSIGDTGDVVEWRRGYNTAVGDCVNIARDGGAA